MASKLTHKATAVGVTSRVDARAVDAKVCHELIQDGVRELNLRGGQPYEIPHQESYAHRSH